MSCIVLFVVDGRKDYSLPPTFVPVPRKKSLDVSALSPVDLIRNGVDFLTNNPYIRVLAREVKSLFSSDLELLTLHLTRPSDSKVNTVMIFVSSQMLVGCDN